MTSAPIDAVTRVCLDLNVWVSDVLRLMHGRTGGASQQLVDIVRSGICELGPVQLVIGWGMLNRLESVLLNELGVGEPFAGLYIASISEMARNGPAGVAPYVVLGGTGVLPVRDEEDRGVRETAFAGGAHVLVTRNFRDFVGSDAEILTPHEVAVVRRAEREVIVAQPSVMLRWIRRGAIERSA